MVTPTIAAINGAAMGVGITLPLLFDVRLAAEDAKIGFVFTRRGIIPEANSNWILPRLIGVSRALELLMSGRTISGTEAAAYGIVSRALPRDELMPAALEFARDMAANTAPGSVAIVKHLVYRGLEETDRLAAMQRETKLTWFAGEQPDAIEGVMAFIERRPPAWKGSKHVELPDV
jgi:enoyl-CoA hydratase/carnithine racemase